MQFHLSAINIIGVLRLNLQKESLIHIADTTTARWLKIFHIYRYGKNTCGNIGYIFYGSIRKARPVSKKKLHFLNLTKGTKVQGQIIRLKKWTYRQDGQKIRSYDNSGILIKSRLSLRSWHIKGPIMLEAGRRKLIIQSMEII